MKPLQQIIFIIAAISLSGCSGAAIQNRDTHYLTAHSAAPLHIPPGIASSTFHNAYPVSDRNYSDAAKEVNVIPPALNSG